MISLNSLSQELLPKTYVKKITLDSNYKQKVVKYKSNNPGYYDGSSQTVLTPGDSSTSRLVLSAKISKNYNQIY